MRGPPQPPKPGHVVEVWWWNHWILGVWDGQQWKTTDGSLLGVDLYWREWSRQ